MKKRRRDLIKQMLLQAWPGLFPIAAMFSKNEYVISGSLILSVIVTFWMRYYKKEWILFTIGLIGGFAMELIGDLVYKIQYWDQGSLFGLPIWLPLLWGYLFILARRIGNIIVGRKND